MQVSADVAAAVAIEVGVAAGLRLEEGPAGVRVQGALLQPAAGLRACLPLPLHLVQPAADTHWLGFGRGPEVPPFCGDTTCLANHASYVSRQPKVVARIPRFLQSDSLSCFIQAVRTGELTALRRAPQRWDAGGGSAGAA